MLKTKRSGIIGLSTAITIIAALILCIPALLSHLGEQAVISDEAIRGTVALEMINSGNYVTPTMYGELYFKKPPLYNWIIIGFFKTFNSQSDFVLRLPTILALLLFAATTFLFIRRQTNNLIAWLCTLAVLSCGRILFYDSMLALIDLWFSWIIFINFMIIYILYNKKRLSALFLLSYFLTAIAFMFKGLPALAFQAISLLTVFIAGREFRKLISFRHAAGILLFFSALATYYLVYLRQVSGMENIILNTLFSESSSRTAVQYGLWKTVSHLFTFPFEVLYHFAPWTFLAVVFFRKGMIRKIKDHPFMRYSALIVLSNISIYWISVEVYPRYLFMFLPLIFVIIFHLFHELKDDDILRRFTSKAIVFLTFFIAILFIALPHTGIVSSPDCLLGKSLLFAGSALVLGILMIYFPINRLVALAVLLLLMRTGFNYTFLEERIAQSHTTKVKQDAISLGRYIHNKEASIYGTTPLDYISGFYITREYGRTLERRKSGYNEDEYYIIEPIRLGSKPHSLFFSYLQWWENRNIMLVKLKTNDKLKSETLSD